MYDMSLRTRKCEDVVRAAYRTIRERAARFVRRGGGRSRHGFPKLNQMPLQESGQENSDGFVSDLRNDRLQCGRELIDLLGCR